MVRGYVKLRNGDVITMESEMMIDVIRRACGNYYYAAIEMHFEVVDEEKGGDP